MVARQVKSRLKPQFTTWKRMRVLVFSQLIYSYKRTFILFYLLNNFLGGKGQAKKEIAIARCVSVKTTNDNDKPGASFGGGSQKLRYLIFVISVKLSSSLTLKWLAYRDISHVASCHPLVGIRSEHIYKLCEVSPRVQNVVKLKKINK